MYVVWNEEENRIALGPQGRIPKNDTRNWCTWINATPDNYRLKPGEYFEEVYDPDQKTVTQQVGGTATAELPYGEFRLENYPALGEQLDALWHDIHNGTLDKSGAFYNSILKVKDNYPKDI